MLLALWSAQGVVAQTDSGWDLKSRAYVGADFWHVEHSAPQGMSRKATFMADQNTAWQFRSPSPWYQLESELNWFGQGQWVLKARGNQATGTELNQLFYDHYMSPQLGVRVGIVDYRISWCRSFDTDNPWIRETDPFCSDNTIKLATDSAPGVQAYTVSTVGDYTVQTLVGLYRPLLGGYSPREYSDAILTPDDRVTKNHKYGVTVNAIHNLTATEWRLGWVGADQAAHYRGPRFQANSAQTVHLFFAGGSWQLHPKLKARVTLMNSHLRGHIVPLDGGQPIKPKVFKGSRVLELNYQHSPQHAFALAYSHYPFEQQSVYRWQHQSKSVSWRYDYNSAWFAALQISKAHNHIQSFDDLAPVKSGKPKAAAIGFRIGRKL